MQYFININKLIFYIYKIYGSIIILFIKVGEIILEKEEYYLWLSLNKTLSLSKIENILNSFNNHLDFFDATIYEMSKLKFLSKKNIDEIISNKKNNILKKTISELKKKKIKYYSKFSSEYPDNLKNIHSPPLIIYVKGILPNKETKYVTIVGSRRCSQYGKDVAFELGKQLSKYKVCVVSGMAYGIDTFAHKGVISSNGMTIAVLGCGVDVVYPKENAKLKNEIEEKGCTISEFHLNDKAMPHNFPKRNRIMAGLSDALIVVEATMNSGTSITVNYALEEGREVLAVPGNIYSKYSQGTNELIKLGATPLTSYKDIVSLLGLEKANNKVDIIKKLVLDENERYIYNLIEEKGTYLDKILSLSKLSVNETQYILTMLEIKEAIKNVGGQKFIK